VVLYFWAMFFVYAFSDVHRSRPALNRVTRRQPLLPGVALEYRDSRAAAFLLGFRALFDVLLPLVYGIAGMVILVPKAE